MLERKLRTSSPDRAVPWRQRAAREIDPTEHLSLGLVPDSTAAVQNASTRAPAAACEPPSGTYPRVGSPSLFFNYLRSAVVARLLQDALSSGLSRPTVPRWATSPDDHFIATGGIYHEQLRQLVRPALLGLLVTPLFVFAVRAQSSATAPVYEITPVVSKITFGVSASISIEGTFDRWNADLSFNSADVSTGVLDVKIEADSANTSRMTS